ncbi:MAG TPA: ferritin-like domain-containing protein [Candidatus Polarisedimenticolia bacterium]|nr:ferritin-like domain-containing protein [Candidatus Polarisedimenticolia bacterium]
MAIENLRELFVEQLKDMYDAEQRIVKALPKMAREATSEELSSAFEEHLAQTQEHVSRLERVFGIVGESPSKKTCKATVGLLEEGEEVMKEDAPESVLDAGLIAAAQKVEHYEMATYGCLRDWAQLLGLSEAVDLLQETLDEEGETDKKLTEIAQSLNIEALEGEDEEEMEGDEEMPRAERAGNTRGRQVTGSAARRSATSSSASRTTKATAKSRTR